MAKIMGIDHGAVRIGIAVSDESSSIAFGREIILNNKDVFERIKKFISDEHITQIVIGYPLTLKGERSEQTIAVERFETDLKKSLSKPPFNNITIIRWDERFTSKMAGDSMLESGMKRKKRQQKGNIDIISASLMLQSYLDSRKNTLSGITK